jgi:hypothetical protein
MLAVATCPKAADHPEVEQYCLQPAVAALLSSAMEEELAQALPDGDHSPPGGLGQSAAAMLASSEVMARYP